MKEDIDWELMAREGKSIPRFPTGVREPGK
jgi:hypothetical protein